MNPPPYYEIPSDLPPGATVEQVLFVEKRIEGSNDCREWAFAQYPPDQGWDIERSGPAPAEFPKVDASRFLIVGRREAPAVSLPPISASYLQLLERTAFNLFMAATRGTTPHCQKLAQRMRNPKLGDHVMEITTPFDQPNRRGFGVLWAITPPPDFVQHERQLYETWTIELPGGEMVDWTSGHFIAIPAEILPVI